MTMGKGKTRKAPRNRNSGATSKAIGRKEVIAKFQARFHWHMVELKRANERLDIPAAMVARGKMESARADLFYVQQPGCWRDALTHYPYTEVMRLDWTVEQ